MGSIKSNKEASYWRRKQLPPSVTNVIPGLNAQLVEFTLTHPNIGNTQYRFGERDVSEGMVYLIESKFYELD